MAAKHIPDGHHSVTPHLVVNNAAAALEFYKKAFGATEIMRMPGPGGKIGHAQIQIGNSRVMMADEHPEMDCRGPLAFGGSPVSIYIYVENVDNVFQQAVAAGATVVFPVEDKFYGDRTGSLKDPFGHSWHIATHTEDVSMDELKNRMAKMGA